MKATGIVRPIDSLGRIVLPKEIRDVMQISPKDPLEIWTDENRIILTKYTPACIFCSSADDVTVYKGKMICAACMKNLKSLA